MKRWKRCLALLLASCLTLGLMAPGAFAAEGDEAQVGENTYETLAQAVKAAKAGDTVILLEDVNLTGSLEIKNKNLTLDLNGHTLAGSGSGSISIAGVPRVTITGGSLGGNTKGLITVAGGTVGLEGLTSAPGATFTLKLSGGTATLSGCELVSENTALALLDISVKASVTVTGSQLVSASSNGVAFLSGQSSLTVEDSTLYGTEGPGVTVNAAGSSVTIGAGALLQTDRASASALNVAYGSASVEAGAQFVTSGGDPVFGGNVTYPAGCGPTPDGNGVYTVGNTCDHQWGEWTGSEPTCVSAGVQTRTCALCGGTETQTISALGHDWSEWTVIVEAACTEEGSRSHTCLREGCGETESEPIPALDHDWSEWTETKAATCTEEGSRSHICLREGCEETESETIPAAGHQYVTEWSSDETSHWHACANCGQRQEEGSHTENGGVVTMPATASTQGVRTFSCTVCGRELRTETIPATGTNTNPGTGSGTGTGTDSGSGTGSGTGTGAGSGTGSGTGAGIGGGDQGGPGISVGPAGGDNTGDEALNDTNAPLSGEPQTGDEELDDNDTPLVSRPFLFEDVGENRWYYSAVKYVFDRELMGGVTETRFDPMANTSRGMLVTVIHRMEQKPAPEAQPDTFSDLKAGKWYTDAVLWAADKGIVNGYSDGTFGPDNSVTREQVAAILFRYAQYKGCDMSLRADLSGYADSAKVARYAYDAMAWAVGAGIIGGVDSTTLDPKGNASRVQIATMLMRLDQYLAQAETEPQTEPVG